MQVWFSNRRAKWRRHQRMNMLKPFNGLSPSPHPSTPGSTSPEPTATSNLHGPQPSSAKVTLGGENSAFSPARPTSHPDYRPAADDQHSSRPSSRASSSSDEAAEDADEEDIEPDVVDWTNVDSNFLQVFFKVNICS